MTQPTAGDMTTEEHAEQIVKAFVTSGSHDDLELFLSAALSAAEQRGLENGMKQILDMVFEHASSIQKEPYSLSRDVAEIAVRRLSEKIVSAIRARSGKQEGDAS